MKNTNLVIPLNTIITNRRSIRRYTNKPILPETIKQILQMAIWAPSAHNRQPWRFAIISSAIKRQAFALAMGDRLRHDLEADFLPEEMINVDVSRSYDRITSAPVVIVICLSMIDMDTYTDTKRMTNEYIMAVQSTAMAGQNLLLAAHHFGLGACWMCAPLFCPDVVNSTLSLPSDWQPQGLITMGYPAHTQDKTRNPLEEITVWR